MRKIYIFPVLFLMFAVFVFPKSANAALVTVNKQGVVVWSVLSYESTEVPKKESLKITSIVNNSNRDTNAIVNLESTNGQMRLSYAANGKKNDIDLTGYTQELVEIEQKNSPETIVISADNGKFQISHKGITAVTSYPISVIANKQELSVKTPSGSRFIAVLPEEAVGDMVRAKIISRLKDGNVNLAENESNELTYELDGVRQVKLFNIISIDVDVVASVSASTGQLLGVEQPIWLSALGFLFV